MVREEVAEHRDERRRRSLVARSARTREATRLIGPLVLGAGLSVPDKER